MKKKKEAGNSVQAAKLSDGLFKRQVASVIIKKPISLYVSL
jgi:hypothetical protein